MTLSFFLGAAPMPMLWKPNICSGSREKHSKPGIPIFSGNPQPRHSFQEAKNLFKPSTQQKQPETFRGSNPNPKQQSKHLRGIQTTQGKLTLVEPHSSKGNFPICELVPSEGSSLVVTQAGRTP